MLEACTSTTMGSMVDIMADITVDTTADITEATETATDTMDHMDTADMDMDTIAMVILVMEIMVLLFPFD